MFRAVGAALMRPCFVLLAKDVYVGNLPYRVTEAEVEKFFASCGKCTFRMIIDRDLQRPKGFGFATFEDDAAADKAVLLNGKELGGRALRINLAQGRQGGFSGGGGTG
eukprot:RCo012634